MNQPVNNWRAAFALYLQKPVLVMLFFGFSAGLPFLLVFSTMSAWLADNQVSRSAIGFFSWVGITYSIKVFWAPVVDGFALPVLDRLFGRRRSWLLLAQLGMILSVLLMQSFDPVYQLMAIALCALLIAFCSATQDIAIDAFRIESADDEFQGAAAAAYLLGYRIALIVSGAGALYIADISSWALAYIAMAAFMLIGLLTTLCVSEPNVKRPRFNGAMFGSEHIRQAFIHPLTDFFRRNGRMALLILAFVGLYRLSDITMGIMANPFYLDLGFSKTEIAQVTKVFGLLVTIAGAFIGGIVVGRYGVYKPLLIGAISAALTNLLFAQLALVGAQLPWLIVTIVADNLSGGFALAAFIAYLSSLTNRAYTATQYALFSSLMTLPGKFISGFSGLIVDTQGYVYFFLYAALMGLPAILISIWFARSAAANPKP